MLRRRAEERITVGDIMRHGYLAGGLDTIEMEGTFGPMQKGQIYVRSLLQQLGGRSS